MDHRLPHQLFYVSHRSGESLLRSASPEIPVRPDTMHHSSEQLIEYVVLTFLRILASDLNSCDRSDRYRSMR